MYYGFFPACAQGTRLQRHGLIAKSIITDRTTNYQWIVKKMLNAFA